MDTRFWTKRSLYSQIDALRRRLGVSAATFPINAIDLAYTHTKALSLEILPFSNNKICGILYKGVRSTSIALNANREPEMQNFDCMHELIHYFIHDIQQCQRICSSDNRLENCIEQDSYLEWQANEGAAQFLVPYQDFIPNFSALLDNPPHRNFWIEGCLADQYGVSPQVITFRLSSLGHEIDQYRAGVPIDRINILSKRQRQRLNIAATNYSALCAFPLEWDDQIGIDGYAYSL